ncbi:DUF5362 family protein [Mucilaginibacter aquariorum]|uniref:DUF5362 domain-containing protein n=1 Tax=Mucilaginibacter aquariorum TaxID=2967225 RepID=A0ABT1T0C8_9SPHI|nr:DUF5362 family protein [Mucilaginibacter aquariorum]MCQ6958044.1 DUF5362 domain-containing protein [Mucilaginibacter aquariorum]
MEIDETPVQPAASEPESKLFLTEEAQYYLQKAGQWAYFLGIFGFVMTGFILIMAMFVGTIFTMMSSMQQTTTPIPAAAGGFFSFFYVLIAVFNFFWSLYLYQFGDRIKKAILYNNTAEATVAFGKIKSFFKLWGITTIVMISLYILIFVFVIIAGVGAASMMGR